jgi:hypothetical protein
MRMSAFATRISVPWENATSLAAVTGGLRRAAVWITRRRPELEDAARARVWRGLAAPSRVIFMKVGLHLGEAWESILPLKLGEERDVGFAH